MTPERWPEIKRVFQQALDTDSTEREAFLERVCAGDPEMRAEVVSLLAAHEGAGSFLAHEDGASETLPLPSSMPSSNDPLLKRCPRCQAWFSSASLLCPADGEVLIEDPTALVGITLDGLFRIDRLVGQGGFGAVFLAHHELLDDTVAVKVLRREVSSNPDLLRRFLREGRVARSIQHPNVVAIHDLRTTESGLAYMVMEYVEGETLRAVLAREHHVTAQRAIALLAPIAEALDHAHSRGVVHRDVKPENIMLTTTDGREQAKLLDLGLAKLREFADEPYRGTALTMPGQYLGSPAYMSPEQWGEPQQDGKSEVDARADVYSLGVIAYELVTGVTPFRSESLTGLRAAHVGAPAPSAHDVSASIPVEFADVLGRALAKDRSNRPSSAVEFVSDLQMALAGFPTNGPADATNMKRLAVVFFFAVVAFAAVLAWNMLGWSSNPEAPGSRTAPAKPYAAMSDDERFVFVDARARAVSKSMSGFEYTFPPDARRNIKRALDRYAARVGTGNPGPENEDLRFVMARARQHVPEFHRIFAEAGVPLVIATYLPMIESEYVAGARSSMGAVGMFQMLPATAALYGGTEQDLADPRRSALLAARYLKEHMATFENDRMAVPLAVAAYNRGPNGIQEYLRDVVVLDDKDAELRFWALVGNSNSEQSPNAENTRYIASFFAAAIVGENPGAFGLEGDPLSALRAGGLHVNPFHEVADGDFTRIEHLAECSAVPVRIERFPQRRVPGFHHFTGFGFASDPDSAVSDPKYSSTAVREADAADVEIRAPDSRIDFGAQFRANAFPDLALEDRNLTAQPEIRVAFDPFVLDEFDPFTEIHDTTVGALDPDGFEPSLGHNDIASPAFGFASPREA